MEGKEAKTTDRSAHQCPNLPDDVLFHILSRLPVRSLLQFKSVCKSWRSIISHPQFIKTHLEKSTNSPDHHHILLLRANPSGLSYASMEISTHALKSLRCPWTNEDSHLQPFCSCDGLILLSVHHRPFARKKQPGTSFVLWNPSIRSYKVISCPYDFNRALVVYGLCFDSRIDDYRVLVVSQQHGMSVVMYNPISDSWDVISEPCYSILSRENGVLVNGALHWVMNSSKSGSWVIVFFDLVEAKLKEVPRPDFGDEYNVMDLVVLMGFLCVYLKVDGERIEIWAMKEYGKKESWTSFILIRDFPLSKPLYFTRKGLVLIEVGRQEIVLYKPENSAYRYLWSQSLRAIPYVESLVLLNGGS